MIVKPIVTVVAGLVLLLQLEPIGAMAEAVSAGPPASGAHRQTRISLVVHAADGVLVPVVLSIYKPRGLTRYGRRGFDRDGDRQRPAVVA
ncbi:MAG TPA: hypothetical protein VM262_21350 [Acidimicrobiales bacterium]|nr:hypothetical protein [Acidimicrobiales bacterium]